MLCPEAFARHTHAMREEQKIETLFMLQGMVQAAAYIYRKLKQESLLERAFNWNVAEGTDKFPLVSIFLVLFFFYILNPF
jgi:hypothetical protein